MEIGYTRLALERISISVRPDGLHASVLRLPRGAGLGTGTGKGNRGPARVSMAVAILAPVLAWRLANGMNPRGIICICLRVVGVLLVLFAFRKFFELWLMAKGIISAPSEGYPANDIIFAIAGAALFRYADRIANLNFRR